MPLQYREARREGGADHVRAALRSELDLVEADLERRSPLDHPTRCLGDQLRAETNAEYGSLRPNPSAQQRDLGTDPRKIVVDAHRSAHRDQQLGVFGVRGHTARRHQHALHARAVLEERLGPHARAFDRFVLQNDDAHQ